MAREAGQNDQPADLNIGGSIRMGHPGKRLEVGTY